MNKNAALLDSFTTFGDLLKYLRVRARLTQRDLSIAVGYSEAQISRQEGNKRVPSEYALKALFVPALGLENEPETVLRLLALAEQVREQDRPWVVASPEQNISQRTAVQPVRHNLPYPLSSFIGREKEINQVVRMVREHPLVTLTGTGGVGKTRLALHSAKELIDDFPDGVWLVELAPVIDPVFVPITVASIFNVHSASGQRLVHTLRDYFGLKRLLLILDNCEHVIDAVAELSTSLLQACPNLRILATSREILDVEGEYFFRCPSLSLPASSPAHVAAPLLKRVKTSEAVQLFVERAAAASPGFRLTEQNALTISNVCQRLDGIPLAIELAAARLRLLSLEQIAGYMDDMFGLLSGSRRLVLPRHKTLKALIDWSYQLLSPAEQILLRRLSVFAGGWTLPAAREIAGGDGVEPGEVLDRMGQLVNKSLISVESVEIGENRYHMLETIRQYAHERLLEAGEIDIVRDRHLAFFSTMIEQANPHDSHTFMSLPSAQRLVKDIDNFRLALAWALKHNIDPGLRIAISLSQIMPLSYSLESLSILQQLLAVDEAERCNHGSQTEELERKLTRGRALMLVGSTKMFWGMRDEAEQVLLESKAFFESIGEPGAFLRAVTSMHLGTLLISADPEQSQVLLETSQDTFKRKNEKTYLSECDRILVALYLYMGKMEQARQLADEGLMLRKEEGIGEITAVEYRGNVEFLLGHYDQAIGFYHQMLEDSYKYDLLYAAYAISQENWVLWAQGKTEAMRRLCDELLAQGQAYSCSNFFFSAEIFLALLDWAHGAYDQAVYRSEEAIKAYRAEFESFTVPLIYILGRVAFSKGQFARAEGYFRQVDDMSDAPRWKWRAYSLHVFGLLAAAQSHQRPDLAERAAVLFGAQEKLFAWLPNLLSPFERNDYTQALIKVKAALSEEAFLAAWARGKALTHQQAFALALGGTSEDLNGL